MDFTGNVKNPFLFDDPAPPADVGDAAANPFLNGGPFDYSATSYTGINPFSDQIDDSNAAGIFGDPMAYPTDMNPFGTIPDASQPFGAVEPQPQAELFGGPVPPMNQVSGDLFGEPMVPAAAPAVSHHASAPPPVPPAPHHPPVPPHPSVPPARPQPPASVASPVIDLMSDGPVMEEPHAAPGRPPPPRPPPPSKETKDLLQTVIGAMEATTDTLHEKLNTTRTPCPSPGSAVANTPSPTPDIQVTEPEKEPDSFSAIFGQTIDESDHEMEEPKTMVDAPPAPETSTTSEDIDLFGDMPSQKPKTKQDILSLFNKPQAQTTSQVDLLSGDLLTEGITAEDGETTTQVKPVEGAIVETTQDAQPIDLLAGDDISETVAPPASTAVGKEAAPSEAPAGTTHMEAQSEAVVIEESVSPEQMSEQTDSEPTVIETNLQGAAEEANKMSILEGEAQDSASMNEEKVEEVFGSPEPIPPAINSSQIEPSELPSKTDASETPSQGEMSTEAVKEPQAEDETYQSKAEVDEVIGIPSSTAEQTDAFGDVNALDAFSAPPEADQGAALFGDATGAFPSSSGDALFGDSQGVPPASPAASLFGDVSQTVPPASPAASLFGDVTTAPPASPATSLFGDVPQSVPPASPAADLFGDAPKAVPPPSPAVGLFGDVPASGTGSSGFDIFDGESAKVAPAPSGADSTGAALFGTATPAPNVGMSLFGAGNEPTLDIFAESEGNTMVNPFAPAPAAPAAAPTVTAAGVKVATDEEFDAFSARFDKVAVDESDELHVDPFATTVRAASPWGDTGESGGAAAEGFGFGDSGGFDSFLAMNEPPPVPQSTPRRAARQTSGDSDDEPMTVVIKPAALDAGAVSPRGVSPVPVLAPPPAVAVNAAFTDTTPRFNPFDRGPEDIAEAAVDASVKAVAGELQRTDSQETPPTPLFEEDQSQPLEPFPRTQMPAPVWEMHLRQPNKKKITGQRFWKKVFVKLTENGCLQLFNSKDDKDPFQELPLQACYSVSDIGAQQFDQFGKIFTVKVQYIFYKERPGVRPGQLSKAERLTTKLSKFAQHAIAGDYEHVKEFASDVRKLGMPVEHAPQISQLLKLGTQTYEDLKLFSSLVEEQLFKLTVHRDRALNYKSEEVQLTAVDEIYVEQDAGNVVHRMIARVRIFFLGFLSGMPEVDLGINDMRKQGKEVVGRHDIIPVITEEWIRLEAVEFHCCVDSEEFEASKHIKFKPPDACYIELMRFRVRPPKNRELPLQVKTKVTIQGRRVEINSEILVPGFSGRKLGQVPCEDVMVRFPLPECWIYMFRVEKHFRYGSVKSAHRRTGKVKGIERLKGAVDQPEAALMEVTSGQAKYEHQHRAIVWRMSRLPKEGQGAYTTHAFSCRMVLTPYDQMPESLDKYCYVEFTMPATTVSHCVMRSVSITSEEPPEKYVRYLARHEYRVEMEFSSGTGPNEYVAATMKDAEQLAKEEAARKQQEIQQQQRNNDSSSDDSS